MPTNGVPKRTIRIEQETWDAFVEATRHHEHGAAGVIRDFITAYLAGPRSKMPRPPKRPSTPE
jgi:hypothetical protein